MFFQGDKLLLAAIEYPCEFFEDQVSGRKSIDTVWECLDRFPEAEGAALVESVLFEGSS